MNVYALKIGEKTVQGLKDIWEIVDSLFEHVYWYNYDQYEKNIAQLPTRQEITNSLEPLIESDKLERETIGYFDGVKVEVYKDHELSEQPKKNEIFCLSRVDFENFLNYVESTACEYIEGTDEELKHLNYYDYLRDEYGHEWS